MTEAELAAIEARANAATEGPWVVRSPGDDDHRVETRPGAIGSPFGADILFEIERPDADFIAAARSDVPALVAEVRKLKDLLETLEWMRPHESGDQACVWCGNRRFRRGDGPFGQHVPLCRLAEALK